MYQLGIHPLQAQLKNSRLARLSHNLLDLLGHPAGGILNARGMNSSVRDQALERNPRDLAAQRIEPGDHDHFRGVVNQDIHAGGGLQRAYVPALATDDAPLHFLIGQRDRRGAHVADLAGGIALNGSRNDFTRLLLGGFFCLVLYMANQHAGIGPDFLVQNPGQLGAGLLL